MRYEVQVEKKMRAIGTVFVECDDDQQAIAMVRDQIQTGDLQTTHVQWQDPEYEDESFEVTNEVAG